MIAMLTLATRLGFFAAAADAVRGHDSAAQGADGLGPANREPDRAGIDPIKTVVAPQADFWPFLPPPDPALVLAREGSLWQEPAACRGLLGRFLFPGHAAVAQW